MNKWRTFMIGQTLDPGSVEILDILHFGRNQDSTIYEIMYLCCRSVGKLSHSSIRKRIYKNTQRCMNCRKPGQMNVLLQRYGNSGTGGPMWPVPKMLVGLRSWDK